MDPRWIIPLLANMLLLTIAGEANHHLAPAGISILVAGLLLPFAGLRLRRGPGLLALVLTGFAMDALGPTAFGSSSVILATGLLVLHAVRHRLVRGSVSVHVATAVLANVAIFAAQPLFAGNLSDLATATPMRIITDLLLSQVAVIAVARWFLALQERALVLWGVDLVEELRQHP